MVEELTFGELWWLKSSLAQDSLPDWGSLLSSGEKKKKNNSVKKKTTFFYKNLPEIIVFNEKMSFAHEPTLTKDNLEKTMKKKKIR